MVKSGSNGACVNLILPMNAGMINITIATTDSSVVIGNATVVIPPVTNNRELSEFNLSEYTTVLERLPQYIYYNCTSIITLQNSIRMVLTLYVLNIGFVICG